LETLQVLPIIKGVPLGIATAAFLDNGYSTKFQKQKSTEVKVLYPTIKKPYTQIERQCTAVLSYQQMM